MSYGRVRLQLTGEGGTSNLVYASDEAATGVLFALNELTKMCQEGFGTMTEAVCFLDINGKDVEQWRFIVA